MKAVIYARFSSDNQREESITAQVRACTDYAQRQGYTVVKIYTDEARSATTDDRPGFLQMIEHIINTRIRVDALIVHKLDRFARNRYDSAFYKRELRRAGVRVESVLEHLDDSPESILMESVIEGMAEYYSRNLAREVMKGMKETALQGKHNGGKPPLGYDVDCEGRYVINETEARAVRIIFDMFGSGKTYGEIINVLNPCFKTKSGREFGKNSLHDILRNKKYIGIYVFNRSTAKKEGRRNNHLSKPPEEIIEIPDAIPPIIDKETFMRVEERMIKNRTGPARSKAKVNYLLSGIIWCGECDHRMTGASSSYLTKKSKQHKKTYYYTCNYANRTRQCSIEKIAKENVEAFVLSELEGQIFNDTAIPPLSEKIVQHYYRQHSDYVMERDQIENELAGTKMEIDNLVNALAAGGVVVPAIIEKLKGLEQKKSTLEIQLQEWQFKAGENLITAQSVAAFLRSKMILLQNKNLDACKRLLQEYVEKVIVNAEKIEVLFKITVDLSGGGGPYLIVTKVKKVK